MSNQPILSPPIPSYEEAVAGSSRHGEEPESVGLLRRESNYRPPNVQSARSSFDSLESLSDRGDHATRRADMERLEVEDPLYQHSNGSSRFKDISQRLAHMKQSLSSRFSAFTPFRNVRLRFPKLPDFISNPAYTPLYRLLGIVMIMIVIYILMASDIFAMRRNPILGASYDRDSMREYIVNNVKEANIKHFAEYMSSFDHLAGTEGDFTLAKYVEGYFNSYSLDAVTFEKYEVYLNYPTEHGRNVSIVGDKGEEWMALLEEGKPKGAKGGQTPSFHALSKSGDVTGHLVYANDGADSDYEELKKLGVELKGSVVLVRAGGRRQDTAWKVRAAQEAGAVGVLVFSDPAAEGLIPRGGPSLEDYVQRDTVALQSHFVGDVLSPGYPSRQGTAKMPLQDNPALPKIPSLPIPWKDAEHLIKALRGNGSHMKQKAWHWAGHGLEWWTGGKDAPRVRLVNNMKEMEKQKIWNVFGFVQGIEQREKKIIVGNHRDSWCFGASDAVSGTAIMLEVAKVMKELMEIGWRPLRTIVFASWDGGAFNSIGSTEYVEDNIQDLRRNGFAYINIGAAVAGKKFSAKGSPLFEDALNTVLSLVPDPETRRSLFRMAESSQYPPLGGGGDFTPFQSYAGVPSLDLSFEGGNVPKRSCYDNSAWMKARVDKDYKYHRAMGQVIGLLLLELADTPVMPFAMQNYASRIGDYVAELKRFAAVHSKEKLEFMRLETAAIEAMRATREFERAPHHGWKKNSHNGDMLEDAIHSVHRQSHNSRMANFEHHLLDPDGGVPERTWFKSILYAPGMRDAHESDIFPAIRDSILLKKSDTQKVIDHCAEILSNASRKLLN